MEPVDTDVKGRDRDERIQAARKKLKSYRAKQAQKAKPQRASIQMPSPQAAKRLSQTIAHAVEDTITRAAEQAQEQAHHRHPSLSAQTVDSAAPPSTSHARTHSRAGHGRGHSRTVSISISADSMYASAAHAVTESLNPQPSNSSRPGSFIASGSHARRHSRSNSRAIQRSSSVSLGSSPAPVVLAVERGPDAWGPSGLPTDWQDLEDEQNRPLPASSPLSTPKARARTSLAGAQSAESSADSQAPSNDSGSSQSSTGHARRPSRHARRQSLATKRESMEVMGGLGFLMGQTDAGSSTNQRRSSRRVSNHRLSGFQSASLLFGGSDNNRRSGAQDFDWRGSSAIPLSLSETGQDSRDSGDRLTALEKLEGRSRHAAGEAGQSAVFLPRSPAPPSWRESQRHSRQSSVQLPSFDDIHGLEVMDKRSSVNLLEANERTTMEDPDASSLSALSGGAPLGGTWSNMLSPSSALSSSQSMPELNGRKSPKPRPASLFVQPDSLLTEGLTTLVEEEEEEDTSSPAVERPSMDLLNAGSSAVEDEDARRRRRQEERETAHRTRLSSLQPRPLKLKSRPASLYAPSTAARSFALSPSLDGSMVREQAGTDDLAMAEQSADGETGGRSDLSSHDVDSAGIGGLSRQWSLSEAQRRVRDSATGAEDDSSAPIPPVSHFRPDAPEVQDSPSTSVDLSLPSAATPGRRGMRALRLGSLSAVADTSLSYDGSQNSGASPTNSMTKRSSVRGFDGLTSSSSQSSLRRSSIMYKPSNSEASSAPPTATFPSSTSASTLAAIEELRAKNLRDAGQLESLRGQVEKLTQQLADEAERASQQYSQLEHSAAQEKQGLMHRIDDINASAAQTADQLAHLQNEHQQASADKALLATELASAQQAMEDVESERDSLVEDVDGWRTRCSDLEKSLREERANLEAERCTNTSLHIRVQVLAERLQTEGIEIPGAPSGEDKASTSLGLPSALVAALKSPALDLNAPNQAAGYFSPRANSPSDATPQAVQLLKDMRQQIFNLAGSLEHERKQHIRAQKDADELRAQNKELLASVAHPSPVARTSRDTPTQGDLSNGSIVASTGRNKRHVFAYDSSMGSADQSGTSVGSGATNLTSLTEIDVPTSAAHKNSHSGSLSGSLLPGGLQPLAEVEDENVTSDVTSQTPEPRPSLLGDSSQHQHSLSELDLQAGGDDEELLDDDDDDVETGGAQRHSYEQSHRSHASTTYDTPALEPSATFGGPSAMFEHDRDHGVHSPSLSAADVASGAASNLSETKSSRGAGSSASSIETDGPASIIDHESGRFSDDPTRVRSTSADQSSALQRPEFIREWSYQEALDAVRVKHGDVSLYDGKTRHTRRQASIDDFFGLLVCEQLDPLPALPSSHTSLDMPPVYVEYEDSPPYGLVAQPDVKQQRGSSALRQASVAATGRAGARPPLARSAYHRDSESSTESGLTRSTGTSASGVSYSSVSSQGFNAARSASLGLAGDFGSRALSRMSLQGLTSAFSGLGGYLAGQSGAAVHAAASATTMCAKGGDVYDSSRNPSISNWPQQPLTGVGMAYDDGAALRNFGGIAGAKRFSTMAPSAPGSRHASLTPKQRQQQLHLASSVSSRSVDSEGSRKGASEVPRRFVDKAGLAAPSPSPVWVLDFVPSTEMAGAPTAFDI
ncbi:unnamed protein product [Parajaminaea phylloscopi]